jgi:hypothetical protein
MPEVKRGGQDSLILTLSFCVPPFSITLREDANEQVDTIWARFVSCHKTVPSPIIRRETPTLHAE